MSRELETYRANLARMDELFPSKELLTRKELGEITGVSPHTVNKLFPFVGSYISKVNVAHRLAELGRRT